MPTIDELEQVVVAADDDVLPVSQSGTARKVSRSQLLAGTQSALALLPGLLGRSAPGLGPPEPIGIGSGLTLSNGLLSGSQPYSAAALPAGSDVSLTDLIPIGQRGRDCSVSVRTLLSVPGIDISYKEVQCGFGVRRRLGDWLADAVTVEAFGAVGDGSTDDSAALSLAIASGRPVRLGPKTYRIDGQWTVQIPALLIGTPGSTTLQRGTQTGGAWINVTAVSFVSIGIIFDAAAIKSDTWGVLLSPTCVSSVFRSCSFLNATGKLLGSGLTIQARDGLTGYPSDHSVADCSFHNNDCHGLWLQAVSGAEVRNCMAWNNGEFGINLDFNDPEFKQIVRRSSIIACRCWGNARGISVGNYNETNSQPPRWGLLNPDAQDIIISGNTCSANFAYGIAVSGLRIQIRQNIISIDEAANNASGILCNSSASCISDNVIVGPGQYGIDSGGSADLAILSNVVENCSIAINAGGSVRIQISDNKLAKNLRAVTIFQTETDGYGQNFGIPCSDVWINGNTIQLDKTAGGIFLIDGPDRVEVVENRFVSSLATDLCWAHTDTMTASGNSLIGSSMINVDVHSSGAKLLLVIPELLESALADIPTTKIDGIIGSHQLEMAGQIGFIRVTSGGLGYTQARVVIAGAGSGASASVYLRDGIIIGIAMTSGGFGYDAATTSVIVIGDGQNATLQASVGVPFPLSQRIRLLCSSAVHFTQSLSLSNWTNADITIPAGGEIVWRANPDGWRAASFTNVDYVKPTGDGSVTVRSVTGNLDFHAGVGSRVKLASDSEPIGLSTSFGRGSPEGVISATPGSDYRNLDGGAGVTFWIKQVGTDSLGWLAIA